MKTTNYEISRQLAEDNTKEANFLVARFLIMRLKKHFT